MRYVPKTYGYGTAEGDAQEYTIKKEKIVTIESILDSAHSNNHAGVSVLLVGQVVAVRWFGNVRIFRIRDWTDEIELLCHVRNVGDIIYDVKLSDCIICKGETFMSERGIFQLKVSKLEFWEKNNIK